MTARLSNGTPVPTPVRFALTATLIAATALIATLLGAAFGIAPAEAKPKPGFEKLNLNDRPGEPVGLAVLPDGRVLHSTRDGVVRIHLPNKGLNVIAAEFDVYQHDEEGLQNIAIDPNFKQNRWVYVYYSPPLDTPVDDPDTVDVNEGDAPFTGTPDDWAPFEGYTQLSRFKLEGNTINLDTEQQIIQVEADRGICCHVGGHIEFDNSGNLYLSTGDDTNPFESDGYVPIDERSTQHPAFDAQRTSANSADLRGKLLRIRVGDDGSYTVPSGNLFPADADNARPEIYAMGVRNPFRFGINPKNGHVFMADYSPDAGEADPLRGPAGHGKWMIIRQAGNYGWPYCATAELPYVDYDFAAETSGEAFDCANLVNDSPNNTGVTDLPPTIQPEVWYSYDRSERFPQLGTGGIGPMGGPAYEFDRRNKSKVKFPARFNGNPLFFEWTRDYIKEFPLGKQGRLQPGKIRNALPKKFVTQNPISVEYGPNGALYVLEYGDGYFAENPAAQLSQFNYVRGGLSPIVKVKAKGKTEAAEAPHRVKFTSKGTKDPDGKKPTKKLRYYWDFDADGKVDSKKKNPTFVFREPGLFDATLRVKDQTGRQARASVEIIVGNVTPQVRFVTPEDGDGFNFGDAVPYEIEVIDDQEVDCSKVRVTYILGHDEHGHPLISTTGCTGTIQTIVDSGHSGEANLRGVFNVSYTDTPTVEGVPALSASAEVALVPGT